jgi:acyl-CoA reductase-like NAD-dependent aldehyde dehydrogenase
MGDPQLDSTTLGPIAQPHHPAVLKALVEAGVAAGGRLLHGGDYAQANGKGRFFMPTVIADAPQRSALMQEEAFGPIVALLPVDGDEQAITLMNDSRFGLTASVWTQDTAAARKLFPRIEAGTVFLNRCDFLDPLLPWSGLKDTGRGVSLSHHGFGAMTRLKAMHFRTREG